ncbi:MAG: peptide ABC transporter substrate-binding protein [Pyrinomonadaceae bacterium]
MEVERRTRTERPSRIIGGVANLRTILAAAVILVFASCTQLKQPAPEPFFSQTIPPRAQEFRWSNGGSPKSLDPALAAAPPETDIVRALYEGLTETDPSTLAEVPGVAESWSASDDHKEWTFKLRPNAKWSNGKPVTAEDFVRAWKRLVKLGDKTAHRNLLSNIAGVPKPAAEATPTTDAALESPWPASNNSRGTAPWSRTPDHSKPKPANTAAGTNSAAASPAVSDLSTFGAVAVDDLTLKVTLVIPDEEFPRLVAHPIFRPIFNNGEEFIGKGLNPNIVTNGPFLISRSDETGIVLERSENYWNHDAIRLERVHMVAMESPETALAAYRAGELDAVTNAGFSPLVVKLLSPYDDFQKATHSALNFYEVNTTKAPFSDRRVRAALSNAIDRDRLTEAETEGTTRPALGFLPYATTTKTGLTQDKEKARDLLDEAGFPDGEGFPVIKLLVNRNDAQQRIARSVAKMWKQNLNVETEIIVKDAPELEMSRIAGDFDLVRRGVVFPTSDQTANFMAIFEPRSVPAIEKSDVGANAGPTPIQGPDTKAGEVMPRPSPIDKADAGEPVILTEEAAIYELRAIPLYFPTSFSLVKPYVAGFQTNSLDAVVLTSVAIDSAWRPATAAE